MSRKSNLPLDGGCLLPSALLQSPSPAALLHSFTTRAAAYPALPRWSASFGHRQPMPVLHRGVAHVAELRLPPGRLAVKSAVGIGHARMRVVLALLAMEAGPAVIIAAAVLGAEALL